VLAAQRPGWLCVRTRAGCSACASSGGAAAGAQVPCNSSFDFLAALRVAKPLLAELQARAPCSPSCGPAPPARRAAGPRPLLAELRARASCSPSCRPAPGRPGAPRPARARAPHAARSSHTRAVHARVRYPNPRCPNPSRRARARQAGAGLRLLLIDNMAAFYWQDRALQPADRAPQPLSFAAARPCRRPCARPL